MRIGSDRLVRRCRLVALLLFLAQASALSAQQLSASPTAESLAEPTAQIATVLHQSFLASMPLPADLRQPVNPTAIAPAMIIATPAPSDHPESHPFWDRQNRMLFALNGALAAADFFSTRRNLDQNGRELNPVARLFTGSTPALATNFALETGGVVGISYLFHKTGHHKLERMTSYVNMGASAAAVGYNLCHH